MSIKNEPIRWQGYITLAMIAAIVLGALAGWWDQEEAAWALAIVGGGGTFALTENARRQVTPVAKLLSEDEHGPDGSEAPDPADPDALPPPNVQA